jgi:hypothetical protein
LNEHRALIFGHCGTLYPDVQLTNHPFRLLSIIS